MVKKCMYCGQPLAREDAHFCNECGRLQVPEPDPLAVPGAIKVRLPPKEFLRREPPPSALVDQQPVPHIPYPPVREPQGEHERQETAEETASPSARTDERVRPSGAQSAPPQEQGPVRPAARELQREREQLETGGEAASSPTRVDKHVHPSEDWPAPVEEISTMVLPGWREELETLRKKQVTPEASASPPSFQPASTTQPAEQEMQEPDTAGASAEPKQEREVAETLLADSSQREDLYIRAWEQEPTRRYPQVQVEKREENEAGPAPAIEHAPFVAAFEPEDETEAERIDIDWQALASPTTTRISEPQDKERTQQKQEARESDVEDLPTVPLAVPRAVKQQPAITIERASTPAPAGKDVSPQEIEDLPTRPMPVSQVPRSPQPAPEGQPAPQATFPASSARPSVPRQSSAPPLQSTREPAMPAGAQTGRGSQSNPASQAGLSFNPAGASALQGPVSSPGNTLLDAQHPTMVQRPAFAPATPPPIAPVPSSRAASREAGSQRVTPLRVALLVVLIVVLGAGAFTFYYQATSGGSIAQAYQAFESSTLGVSLNYPQGWAFSLNRAQTSVHFVDSSQTGQVMLNMTVPGAASVTQYLDQEIRQLGIAVPQLAPTRLFGGESWQQVQGDMVQQGVTYTLDLYAARHGTHIYTLIFLAPPPAYGRMEQESFAPLRASFRFIPGQ